MSRFLLCVSVSMLVACGAEPSGDGKGDGRNCTAQTDCDSEWRKVCEDGYCSSTLPANSEMVDGSFVHRSKLDVVLSKVKFRKDAQMSYRLIVVYPVTPDGRTVDCSNIAPYEVLKDPSKYNLTDRPQEGDVPAASFGTLVYLNGPGRVVYLEIYDGPLNGNPKVVGVACLENPARNDGGKLGMTPTPPA